MNDQLLVRWGDSREELDAFLISKGYTQSVHEGEEPPNRVSVYCVDLKKKRFYQVNAMVCAAWASVGKHTLTPEEARDLV